MQYPGTIPLLIDLEAGKELLSAESIDMVVAALG